MIIMLVPREKSRKVACVLNGTEMLSPKVTTNKNMPSPTLSGKQLTIIFHKKTLNCFLPKQLPTKACLLPHYLESS